MHSIPEASPSCSSFSDHSLPPGAHWVSPFSLWGPKLGGPIALAPNPGGSAYQLCDLT